MLPIPCLDPTSPLPLYKQLTDHIRDSIVAGRLTDGDRLPPTRELAGSLGLNRATVSAAYQALESEGLLKGHVGRGSFVRYTGAVPGSSKAAPGVRLITVTPENREELTAAVVEMLAGRGPIAAAFTRSG